MARAISCHHHLIEHLILTRKMKRKNQEVGEDGRAQEGEVEKSESPSHKPGPRKLEMTSMPAARLASIGRQFTRLGLSFTYRVG